MARRFLTAKEQGSPHTNLVATHPISQNGITPSTGVWGAGKGVWGVTTPVWMRPRVPKGTLVSLPRSRSISTHLDCAIQHSAALFACIVRDETISIYVTLWIQLRKKYCARVIDRITWFHSTMRLLFGLLGTNLPTDTCLRYTWRNRRVLVGPPPWRMTRSMHKSFALYSFPEPRRRARGIAQQRH